MIENTARRDPLLHLLGSMTDDAPGRYIEDMEAAGQRQLVHSDRLPTKSCGDDAYLRLGFTLGAPDPDDPLFRPATLPNGWHKQPSDHAMWSHIVDEHGRRRVAIFYKAAFYDRKATMHLESVHSYAVAVVAGEVEQPIFDDTWCTREAFAAALTALHREYAGRVEVYENATDRWAAKELPKVKADLAKVRALITKYPAAMAPNT